MGLIVFALEAAGPSLPVPMPRSSGQQPPSQSHVSPDVINRFANINIPAEKPAASNYNPGYVANPQSGSNNFRFEFVQESFYSVKFS